MVKPVPEAAIRAAVEALHSEMLGTAKPYNQIPAGNLRVLRRLAIAGVTAASPALQPARKTFRERLADRHAYAGRLTAPVYRLILTCTWPGPAVAQ